MYMYMYIHEYRKTAKQELHFPNNRLQKNEKEQKNNLKCKYYQRRSKENIQYLANKYFYFIAEGSIYSRTRRSC